MKILAILSTLLIKMEAFQIKLDLDKSVYHIKDLFGANEVPKNYTFQTLAEIHAISNDEYCTLNITDGVQSVYFSDVDYLPEVTVIPSKATEEYVQFFMNDRDCDNRAAIIFDSLVHLNYQRTLGSYFQTSYAISKFSCQSWSETFVKMTQARLFAKLSEQFGIKTTHHASQLVNVNSPCAEGVSHFKIHLRTHYKKWILIAFLALIMSYACYKPFCVLKHISTNPNTKIRKFWNQVYCPLVCGSSEILFIWFTVPHVNTKGQMWEIYKKFWFPNENFDSDEKRDCAIKHMQIKILTQNPYWYAFKTKKYIPARQADQAIEKIRYFVDYLEPEEHAEFVKLYKDYITVQVINARQESRNQLKESLRPKAKPVVREPVMHANGPIVAQN